MENKEIEVGEYLRDIDGIIIKVNIIIPSEDEEDIWYEEKMLKGTWKSMVVKHSKNIIDLIEVGDYVNRHRVKAVYLDGATKYIKLDNAYENGKGIRTYEEDIKSIVTKEQMSQIEYKVGE